MTEGAKQKKPPYLFYDLGRNNVTIRIAVINFDFIVFDVLVGDIQDYVCEQITGLDVSTVLCKLKIKDIECIVNGKISDPVLELPQNVYSTALDMHTKIIITAKPHLQLD